MFSVGYGSANREASIRKIAKDDRTTAVILAAVHFEWMLKRAILKLGSSPTKALRSELEGVYRIHDVGRQPGYKTIWEREVTPRFKKAALGTVLGRLTAIEKIAINARGQLVHGNGTVGQRKAAEAVELFLGVGEKIRSFAESHGVDLDSRLSTRIKPRTAA